MRMLTPEQHSELIKLHDMGWSFKALATKFNISKTSAFFYYHTNPVEVSSNGESANDLQTTRQSVVGGAYKSVLL